MCEVSKSTAVQNIPPRWVNGPRGMLGWLRVGDQDLLKEPGSITQDEALSPLGVERLDALRWLEYVRGS